MLFVVHQVPLRGFWVLLHVVGALPVSDGEVLLRRNMRRVRHGVGLIGLLRTRSHFSCCQLGSCGRLLAIGRRSVDILLFILLTEDLASSKWLLALGGSWSLLSATET